MAVTLRVMAACALLCAAAALPAQSSGAWEIAAQGMTSTGPSVRDGFFGGQVSGVSQSALSVRATTDLLRVGPVRLRYSAQLTPLVVLRGVENYTELQGRYARLYVLSGTTRVSGIGFSPLGLDVAVNLGPRLRLQAGAATGVYRFSQSVPLAASRARNFTAEWDTQLSYQLGRGRAAQVGVRWRHLSNGYTAPENPGVDNRMVFGGMSWTVRAPR